MPAETPKNIRRVDWPQVAEAIRRVADRLDATLARLQSNQPRANRSIAFFNLGYRALSDLRSAAELVQGDICALAWHVRNLHEIDLTLRYVASDEATMAAWLAQMAGDEIDVVEGFLMLAEKMEAADGERLAARAAGLRSQAGAMGLTIGRPWRTSEIAKATGRDLEYRLFYKFYSKFIHPTSWIVNGHPARTGSQAYRDLLVGLTQTLGDRISKIMIEQFHLEAAEDEPIGPCVDWRLRED